MGWGGLDLILLGPEHHPVQGPYWNYLYYSLLKIAILGTLACPTTHQISQLIRSWWVSVKKWPLGAPKTAFFSPHPLDCAACMKNWLHDKKSLLGPSSKTSRKRTTNNFWSNLGVLGHFMSFTFECTSVSYVWQSCSS